MNRAIEARLKWVNLFNETNDAGIVCRRCGVSRPTLRKWVRRYRESGIEGLKDRSKRPNKIPRRKVTSEYENWILDLRRNRKLGARRIQTELKRLHELSLSLSTIHKVLTRNNVQPIKRFRRKAHTKRYERPIPGDRIQMDTCKIGPRIYQYTAVDDCTRYRVLALCDRRNAANTLSFLEKVIEEMPFSIQRIQTDRGTEFFSTKVQKRFMDYSIKFRPIKPGSPHLNGKVERSQKTDLEEFYNTVDINAQNISDLLQEWQHYYNWERPHGSLNGKTPMDKYFELSQKTPFWDEVENLYDASKERIKESNYYMDLRIRKLKRSV
ncbi:MAG: IS481 family transposase [Syntrophales bacterium]|jgi:transposase InsO family protein